MKAVKSAIIVPIYHKDLSTVERISLQQMLKVFSKRHFIFLIPQNANIVIPGCPDCEYLEIPQEYLNSITSYNRLMLSTSFYQRLLRYSYILICQLDVFVFFDSLDDFVEKGYDYYGPPWINGMPAYEGISYDVLPVGNGGFSLRKPDKMIEALKWYDVREEVQEDIFFSSCSARGLSVAPIDICLRFAFETEIRKAFERNGKRLPMAVHAWNKYDYDFLKPFIEREGYDLTGVPGENRDEESSPDWNQIAGNADALKQKMEHAYGKTASYIIWGAGQRGHAVGWLFKKAGIDAFCYVDLNKNKQNHMMHDKPIRLPNDYLDQKTDYFYIWIICVKNHENDIETMLEKRKECDVVETYSAFLAKLLDPEMNTFLPGKKE